MLCTLCFFAGFGVSAIILWGLLGCAVRKDHVDARQHTETQNAVWDNLLRRRCEAEERVADAVEALSQKE